MWAPKPRGPSSMSIAGPKPKHWMPFARVNDMSVSPLAAPNFRQGSCETASFGCRLYESV
jgi:hypothetical protein